MRRFYEKFGGVTTGLLEFGCKNDFVFLINEIHFNSGFPYTCKQRRRVCDLIKPIRINYFI